MHIMLDLETFGTKPGCVIRSIGAVAFDLAGKTYGEYTANVDKQSCLDAGLIIDPNTERWWNEQSVEAQRALESNVLSLSAVADQFHRWFIERGGLSVWCQGANFDAPLWEAAASAIGARVPWKYHSVRDTRTVYAVCGFDPGSLPRGGTHHNAIHDAYFQVACVAAALARRDEALR